jgi:hypothetical protein
MITAEDATTRLATLVATVINMSATLNNETVLRATDPTELRSTLRWIADEMAWFTSIAAENSVSGIVLPADAESRVRALGGCRLQRRGI